MAIDTLGEKLKQARTERGLSLEQVSRAIHVRTHYLEALENDQRSALPSAVQGKGFLRLYAGYLNLPESPLLAMWDGKPTEPDQVVEQITSEEPAEAAGAEGADEPSPALAETEPAWQPAESIVEEMPTSSQVIFRAIGDSLRKQREALGLSRVEIERYTKLRQRYIQALEDGDMDFLPSPVQGRGMLSNYAAFLNMDEEAVLLQFAEGLQVRRVERLPKQEPQGIFNPKKRPARNAPGWRRFLTPDLIFGVGMVGMILFFALWTAARISSLRSGEVEPTTPAISDILLTPAVQETKNPQATGTGPAPAGTSVAGQNSEAPAVINVNPPVIEQGGTGGAEAGAELSSTLAPMNDDPLQVYIIASKRAWLRVTTDDKVAFLGRVVPGNAYAFSGEKRLELLTGNGAAIQVFYNQMDMGFLGSAGEVVGLVFDANGIATPTAAFSPTPTATKLATITPLPSATPQATATVTPFVPD